MYRCPGKTALYTLWHAEYAGGAAMSEAAPQAATGYWCKLCKEPVRLKGPARLPLSMRKAVHAATGSEAGPGYGGEDGHAAVPTDEDPVLRAVADQIKAEFPQCAASARLGIVTVTLRHRHLAQKAVAVPYKGRSVEELRPRLRAALAAAGIEAP
jgi:hypothetical protein